MLATVTGPVHGMFCVFAKEKYQEKRGKKEREEKQK